MCVCFSICIQFQLCNKTQIAMDTKGANRGRAGGTCGLGTMSKVFINFGCLIHFACQIHSHCCLSVQGCLPAAMWQCHKNRSTLTEREREQESKRERERDDEPTSWADNSNVIYKRTRLICYSCYTGLQLQPQTECERRWRAQGERLLALGASLWISYNQKRKQRQQKQWGNER